jgi:hypothetical protein
MKYSGDCFWVLNDLKSTTLITIRDTYWDKAAVPTGLWSALRNPALEAPGYWQLSLRDMVLAMNFQVHGRLDRSQVPRQGLIRARSTRDLIRVLLNDCGAAGFSPAFLIVLLQQLSQRRLVLLCRFAGLLAVGHNLHCRWRADALARQGLDGRDRAEPLLFLLLCHSA